MKKILEKTLHTYSSEFKTVACFSALVLFSLLLIPFVTSYVNIGSGFVRFSSLYLDITINQALFIGLFALVSIFILSVFTAAMITIVKLRQTLDRLGFEKVLLVFPKYVTRMFSFFLVLGIVSILFGTALEYAGAPRAITHLVLAGLWLAFAFGPQVIVIEDFHLVGSFRDAIAFIKRNPIAPVAYAALGVALLLIVAGIETLLGRYLLWEHKIITTLLVSLVVLPITQIFATHLYLKRYPMSHL